MTAKTTGAEFKRFYGDNEWWPEGVYHDDELILVNGEAIEDLDALERIPDEAEVRIESGSVMREPREGRVMGEEVMGLDTYFHRWRRAQSKRVVVLEVPIEDVERLKAMVKAERGWRIWR